MEKWTSAKRVAIDLFGDQRVTFEELPGALVCETEVSDGFADPRVEQLVDGMQACLPDTGALSMHRTAGTIVFMAGVSRRVLAAVERQRGYRPS